MIATWTEPNASSNCYLGPSTLTQTSGLSNGSLFPVGTTTIQYEAKDDCQSFQTCSFTVSVEQDDLTYQLTCPDNLILTAPTGASEMLVDWNLPIATTNCEVNSSELIQTSGPTNGTILPIGTTTVTYEYHTGCDLSTSCLLYTSPSPRD